VTDAGSLDSPTTTPDAGCVVFCFFSSSTISSWRGLFMKLSRDTWIADPVFCRARGVRSWWETTRS